MNLSDVQPPPDTCAGCDRIDRCYRLFVESLLADRGYQGCTQIMLRIALSCRMPMLVFTGPDESISVGSWQPPEAEKIYKDAERQRDEIAAYLLERLPESPTCIYRERQERKVEKGAPTQ